MVVGRLAPTPSGQLHLGNVLAFAGCWLSARSSGGQVLVRVEDVDIGRSRFGVAADQLRDLEWLGFDWDGRTPDQSDRTYQPFADRLIEHTYRCVCTRKQRQQTTSRCACDGAKHPEGALRFRLDGERVAFEDRRFGSVMVDPAMAFGDPTLQRRDGVWAYNLAVVVDDIVDGVTEVVRGADLLEFTAVQIQLWRAFGATPPTWLHTPLVLGADGRKLGKSHGSTELRHLRDLGWTPSRVWQTVLPWLGIQADSLVEALPGFEPTRGPLGPLTIGDAE